MTSSVSFEEVLEVVGGEGRWQLEVLLLATLQGVLSNLQMYAFVFLLAVPDHWCHVPTLEAANWTQQQIQKVALPRHSRGGQESYSQCHMFDHNYTQLAESPWSEEVEDGLNTTGVSVVPCQSWVYSTADYEATLVSQWDLVCSRVALASTTESLYVLGQLSGSLVGGVLSDRFGRRLVIIVTMVIWAACSVAVVFVPYHSLFLALRLAAGAGQFATYTTFFTLVMEIVALEARARWTNYFNIGNALGIVMLAGVGYWLRHWRSIQLATSLPCLLLPPLSWWLLPESPRWLILKGRCKEAEEILRLAAAKNRKSLPESDKFSRNVAAVMKGTRSSEVAPEAEGKDQKPSSWRLFFRRALVLLRARRIRYRCIKVNLAWLVTFMLLYGVTYASSKLDTGPVVLLALQGTANVISRLTTSWPLERFGRKPTFVAGFVLAGVSSTAAGLMPEGLPWAVLCLFVVASFSVATLFPVVYLVTVELFPTQVRNMALGVGNICGRCGGMAATYVVDLLAQYGHFIPSMIFGGLAAMAALATAMLPETKEETLPDTLEDVEEAPSSTRSSRLDLAEDGKVTEVPEGKQTNIPEKAEMTRL